MIRLVVHRPCVALLALAFIVFTTGIAAAADSEVVDIEEAAAAIEAETAAEGAGESGNFEPMLPSSVTEGQQLQKELGQIRERIYELLDEVAKYTGDDQGVLEHQLAVARLDYLKTLSKLVVNVQAQADDGLAADELRAWIAERVLPLSESISAHIDSSEARLQKLRNKHVSAQGSESIEIEEAMTIEIAWLQSLQAGYVQHLFNLVELALDSGPVARDIHQRFATSANWMAGRLELTSGKLQRLEERAAQYPDDKSLQEEIRLVKVSRKVVADAMTFIVDQMDRVGLDSSDYRRLLIRVTGEVSADVFKGRVALGLVEEVAEDVRDWVKSNALMGAFKALIFVMTLVIFRLIAAITRRLVLRSKRSSKIQTSQLLHNMTLSFATRGIMFLGLLVALSQVGVELAPLLTGLGIAGFIIGFALQDSLSNFASGVMILGYRPFDVDDMIEAGGVFGSVSNMSLVSTTILTIDNQTLIVPNSKIWGDVIKNLTGELRRRVDLKFYVAHSADVTRVAGIFEDILASHPKVLSDPEPMVKLHKLLESSLEFIVRPWVETADYWDVYWDVTQEVMRRFNEERIELPYPRQDVRLVEGSNVGESWKIEDAGGLTSAVSKSRGPTSEED